MNDENDLEDRVPWEVIRPVVEWMTQNRVGELRLVATPTPTPHDTSPSRDESDSLIHCDKAPDAEGLRDIYIVSDRDGDVRLNGPSRMPHEVLAPLLKALGEASVSEIRIAAGGIDGSALEFAHDTDPHAAFEEHEEPSPHNWPPAIIAVKAERGRLKI